VWTVTLLRLRGGRGTKARVSQSVRCDLRPLRILRREAWLRVALVVGATLATVGALEAALRAWAAVEDRKNLLQALERPPEIPADRRVELGHIVRLSRNRRIVYELVPNLQVIFRDEWITTNAAGYRGPDRPVPKPENAVRIVGLGDSVMFGWGVADGNEYMSLLESRLNREYPERQWQVVNLSVPGYNTVMEVETLKEKGLRLRPDFVVLGYCGNDLNLPSFIRDEREYFSVRESFLLEFLRDRLARGTAEREGSGLTKGEGAEELRGFEDDPGKVPRAYADMVGRDSFVHAVEELEALGRDYAFETLVLAYPTVPPRMRPVLGALRLPVLDPAPRVQEFLRTHGHVPFKGSTLTLGSDPHPSATGHALIADALFEHLVASRFVARQLAKSVEPTRAAER
jgi:lysophospholipase L1-like esterase